jgi:hypothetical protein
MARHPEVSEKSIIQAGQELETQGKTPNPGSIRAHLGYKGGLLRIKGIWNEYLHKREQNLLPNDKPDISFDALPDEYASNACHLMNKVSAAIEQLAIEAYIDSQKLFEKRIKIIEQSHQEKLIYYEECEIFADKSIENLESEVNEAQIELQSLAGQNAKLLLQNSELKGRLSVFEERQLKTDGIKNAV